MSKVEILISFLTVILSVSLSYLSSQVASKKTYRKEVTSKMYEKVIFPLYELVSEDICNYKTISSYAPPEDYVNSKRRAALHILKDSNGMYTYTLKKACDELSPKTLQEFCRLIERNYNRCISELEYYLPYEYYGKSRSKAMNTCVVSSIISTALYVTILTVPIHNMTVAIAIVTVFLFSLAMAIQSSKAF